ncbi:MAG: four helix bundle protein [Gemmatimonadales bacterium]
MLPSVTSDPLWNLEAYRSALFLTSVARDDAQLVPPGGAPVAAAAQLLRAAGSVSANIGEGYSRRTRTDRLRFLEYALGSARECISWYEALGGTLGAAALDSRRLLVARIRALLLGLIRSLRERNTPRTPLES